MEIRRVLDRNTGLPTLKYHGALVDLAQRLLAGKAVIFLGAGCNMDAEGSLASATELSREMAEKCNLEWHEYIPLSTIAFYYESFFSREQLNRYLVHKLDRPGVRPSTAIRGLVQVIETLESLGVSSIVITTNYDQQLERAYSERMGRELDVVVYHGGTDANHPSAMLHPTIGRRPLLWSPSHRTTLYKMHGCISQPESPHLVPSALHNLVVTEEDYINFLSNALSQNESKYLLPHVLARIADSATLFIGYSLTDWNFRVVFKATAERHATPCYAVQLFQPRAGQEDIEQARHEAAVEFWGKRNVNIINLDAGVFVSDLLDTINREISSQPPRTDRRRSFI
jgi:hypothetical protein